MTCIATCYSHYGAISFKRLCQQLNWPAQLLPVPRTLSSSCGTCVCYEGALPPGQLPEEVEQIVQVTEVGYAVLYRADGS